MKRHLAALLIAGTALATPASALDLTSMSEAERDAFRAEVRAYLLDNPEVIMEAVAVLEERQAASQVAQDAELVKANAPDLFEDENSWTGGNPEGDVTMVEFIDYRCGYCRRAHDEVAQLIESDGDIRFIIKEFPILGEASLVSSQFAIATRMVEGDAAYKQVADALIKLKANPEKSVLQAMADSLGLDGPAIIAKMDSGQVNDIIAENRALGQRLNISGTPTFVMDDMVLRGYMPLAQMQDITAQIRAE